MNVIAATGNSAAAPARRVLARMDRISAPRSGSDGAPARISTRLAGGGGASQAFVKVIRNGGTKSAKQIKTQIDYLSREGDVDVQRSERYGGFFIDQDAQEVLAQSWTIGPSRDVGLDLTTHLVVSFPIGTDQRAAEGAARAWAQELFDSGKHGDAYDYVSVFHTDTAHPHMHFVVNRRGIENGEWLKISNRGQINYDVLRDVQVETAREFGIDLAATPRASRGLVDRPITDAEYRRAERENRAPVPRAHTEDSARDAGAAIDIYADQIAYDAAALLEYAPSVAGKMLEIASALREGSQLTEVLRTDANTDPDELAGLNAYIESSRKDVGHGFQELDNLTGLLPDSLQRIEIERQTADWRREIAPFIAGSDSFARETLPDSAGRYRGLAVHEDDDAGQAVVASANELVRLEAERAGLDPARLIARYNGNTAVPRALAEQWRKMEQAEMNPNAGPDDIQRLPDEHHARIETIYANARSLMREPALQDRTQEELVQGPEASNFATATQSTAKGGGGGVEMDEAPARAEGSGGQDHSDADSNRRADIKQRLLSGIPELSESAGQRRGSTPQWQAITADCQAGTFGAPGTLERRHAMMREAFSTEELRAIRLGDLGPLRARTNDTNQIEVIASQYMTAFDALADAGPSQDRIAAQANLLADVRANKLDTPGGRERRFNLMRAAFETDELKAIEKGDLGPLRALAGNESEAKTIAGQHKIVAESMSASGLTRDRDSALMEIRRSAADALPNTPEARERILAMMRIAYSREQLLDIERAGELLATDTGLPGEAADKIVKFYTKALSAESRETLNNIGNLAREADRAVTSLRGAGRLVPDEQNQGGLQALEDSASAGASNAKPAAGRPAASVNRTGDAHDRTDIAKSGSASSVTRTGSGNRSSDEIALQERTVAARERALDRQTSRVQASVNSEQAEQRRRLEVLKSSRARSDSRVSDDER